MMNCDTRAGRRSRIPVKIERYASKREREQEKENGGRQKPFKIWESHHDDVRGNSGRVPLVTRAKKGDTTLLRSVKQAKSKISSRRENPQLRLSNNTPTDNIQKEAESTEVSMPERVLSVARGLSCIEAQDDYMVTNVDEKNFIADPLLMFPYAGHIAKYYKENECKSYVANAEDISVVPKHREILVNWLVDLQVHLCLEAETLHLAVALTDAYLRKRSVSTLVLQLLGVTCVFIACKYEEIYIPDIQTLIDLCANAFTKSQLLYMERRILRLLDFKLFFPTGTGFLSNFLLVNDFHDVELVLTCKYLLDLSLYDVCFQCMPPSLRAAAALYLSLLFQGENSDDLCGRRAGMSIDDNDESVWTTKLAVTTGYHEVELREVTKLFAKKARDIRFADFRAPFDKYNSQRFGFISKRLSDRLHARYTTDLQ